MSPFKADARNHREKSLLQIEIVQYEPFEGMELQGANGVPLPLEAFLCPETPKVIGLNHETGATKMAAPAGFVYKQ